MAQKLITIIILFFTVEHIVSAIEPGCEDCGCCVNNTCETKSIENLIRDNVCTYGCIDGYGGNRCYNKCPDDCVTCEHTFYKNCATCETGKYLTMNTKIRRCEDCPTRCKTCTSTTNCQECNPPYYNDDNVTDCSLPCLENCLCQFVGICTSCQDGFYSLSILCQNACPDKCKTCSDNNTCEYCKEGYYNGKEYDKADGDEISNCSLTCRENCTSCNSYDQCTRCTDGKYGTLCQNTCSVGCTNGNCAADYGSCQCKDGFTGLTCSECMTGRYGETCKACPAMCKLVEGRVLCERTSGICTACVDGFYGDFCDSACSNQCLNNRCVKDNGHCSDGCLNGYEGPTCAGLTNRLSASMAVGISSAVTIVVAAVSIFVSFIVLRRWLRHAHDSLKQHHEPSIQASYENTEFHSILAETVQSVSNDGHCRNSNYEELNACNTTKTPDHDQV